MQTVVKFVRKEGAVVKIDSTPLAIMKKYRQVEKRDKEAGGILLGRMIENSDDVIVDEISVPGMFDRRNRFSFFRSKYIQRIINIKWRSSLHTKNYIGEWHTHPEPYPSPSGKDLSNWQNIMSKGIFDQDFLIFVIVGQLTISAWELKKHNKIPHQLQQVN